MTDRLGTEIDRLLQTGWDFQISYEKKQTIPWQVHVYTPDKKFRKFEGGTLSAAVELVVAWSLVAQ